MAMIIGLNSKASVMGAKKLRRMIEKERKVFEEEVTASMSSVANVLSYCGHVVNDSLKLDRDDIPLVR
jgi:hypothetical protein